MDSISRAKQDQVAPKEDERSMELDANVASAFTYASYQNSVPVVRWIRLINRTGKWIENAELSLSASPAFLRTKR